MSCNGKFSKAMWLSFCLIVGIAVATVMAAQERVKFPVGVGTKTLGTGLIWLGTKKGFFKAGTITRRIGSGIRIWS